MIVISLTYFKDFGELHSQNSTSVIVVLPRLQIKKVYRNITLAQGYVADGRLGIYYGVIAAKMLQSRFKNNSSSDFSLDPYTLYNIRGKNYPLTSPENC